MRFFYKLFFAFLLISSCFCESNDPPGHLQPLGSHVAPMEIEVRSDEIDPKEFFEKYVIQSKPVLMKGAAKRFPSYENWRNDTYLKEHYGKWNVHAEVGKKETRSGNMLDMTYGEYIEKYNNSDLYLVTDITPELSLGAEVFIPKCMQCGGLIDVLLNCVMWFSSGGTKSVLHNDDLDNINCLYDGTKDLVMIDKKHSDLVPIDRPDGGFSSVDVEKVDMYKYPTLRNVPWYKAKMEAGDCFFIPYKWFHHVDSSKTRNLAINLWFLHTTFLPKINECPQDPSTLPSYSCLTNHTLLPEEQQSIYHFIVNHLNPTTLTMSAKEYVKSFTKSFEKIKKSYVKGLFQVFRDLDTDNDKIVTLKEAKASTLDTLNLLQNVMEKMTVLNEKPVPVVDVESQKESDNDPPGHLKPLGSHAPPQSIEERSDWPDPVEFFEKYQKPGKPVLFSGLAKKYPTFENFQSDSYLKKQFGDWKVEAEEGKKEDRSKSVFNMTFSEYLDKYNTTDMYLVQDVPIPSKLADEVFLPKPVVCGGYADLLSTSIIWFSSGGTKSVLHNDETENINCLFDGTKTLVMIDKQYASLVPIDSDGGYSSLDVEKVDMKKYPTVSKLPWFNVTMNPGDCLYIPARWYHQVNSMPTRNLAINLWWTHLHMLGDDCPADLSNLPNYRKLSDFQYSSPDDPKNLRANLLSMFDNKSGTAIFRQLKGELNVKDEDLKLFFKTADADNDSILTYKEVFALPLSSIEKLYYEEVVTVDSSKQEL